MGKRMVKIWDLPSAGAVAALVILSVSFFLGGVSGCLLAGRVSGENSPVLSGYLHDYLTAMLAGLTPHPEWISTLWETVRWPLLVLALGLTPLGLLGIPAVFFVRGFLLSFTVASFFCALGTFGLTFSFFLFGVVGLICIPVLFILGIQGFLCAGALTGHLLGEIKRPTVWSRANLLRCGVCAVVLFACSVAEHRMVPAMLETLAGFWPG